MKKKTAIIFAVAIMALLLASPLSAQQSQSAVVPTTTTPTTCSTFLYALTTASPWTIYAPTTANGCQALGSGGGSFTALTGDATSTSTGGATTVQGLKGVPFCTGYTPTNGQAVTLTTASSPNPCYTAATPGGGGTVTSVALTGSGTFFSSTPGTAVTTAGTLNVDSQLATQVANCIFAGPTSGSAATPACRALVAADIPSLSGTYLPLSGGTLTGELIQSANGGTSTPVSSWTGSLATGAGAIPLLVYNGGGTTPAWNTNGELWGIEHPAGFAGYDFLSFTNATLEWYISAAGNASFASIVSTGVSSPSASGQILFGNPVAAYGANLSLFSNSNSVPTVNIWQDFASPTVDMLDFVSTSSRTKLAFFDNTGSLTVPNLTGGTIETATNCSSSASPAICGSAAAGSVALPTNAVSSSIVVNTTAVTANSQILVTTDDTLGTKLGVTCNSTVATLVGGLTISARTPGTSFTIANNVAVVTNPLCVSYLIIN